GASSLLPGRHNSKTKDFGALMSREEAPVLPLYVSQVRISAMSPNYQPISTSLRILFPHPGAPI
ncbi:MAG: hypothetical protein V3R99_08555, partial [Thermoguttaceae bacterium]